MPVPTLISDLSTTAASNSPTGGESVGNNADNYLRAHAAFIAQLEANKLDSADAATTYQPLDALLTSLAGQTTAANKVQAYSAADTASLLDFKDEDDMVSNSATAVPSQQSVKAYVDGSAGGIRVPVRQAVLSGPVDANGYAAFLTTGSGLRPGLDASPTPVAIAFANGFGAQGAVDYVSVLSADVTDPLGADLPANNLSHLYTTYSSPTAVTWGSTLNPPQYGYSYDRTRQSLLRFAGTDGSTTILDDYGNTWTASGNAQIDTAVQIDGLNTLLLDGTGDYISSTNFTSFGSDGWTIEFKVRFNSLAAVADLLSAGNAGNYGVGIRKGAGTGTTLALYLSSTGTSWDLASGTLGAKASWATGTTYHIALCFDAVNSKYVLYVDGVADITVSTGARICAVTQWLYGYLPGFNYTNGAFAGCRYSPFCRYPNGATFTPAAISTYAVEGHFFSIPEMKMYEVTSASASVGTNPGMTQRNRVFAGQATTGAASVSSIAEQNYRDQRRWKSFTIGAGGERYLANIYRNNTPFMRTVSLQVTVGGTPGEFYIDNTLMCQYSNAAGLSNTQIIFDIPPGSSYKITNTVPARWFELTN